MGKIHTTQHIGAANSGKNIKHQPEEPSANRLNVRVQLAAQIISGMIWSLDPRIKDVMLEMWWRSLPNREGWANRIAQKEAEEAELMDSLKGIEDIPFDPPTSSCNSAGVKHRNLATKGNTANRVKGGTK